MLVEAKRRLPKVEATHEAARVHRRLLRQRGLATHCPCTTTSQEHTRLNSLQAGKLVTARSGGLRFGKCWRHTVLSRVAIFFLSLAGVIALSENIEALKAAKVDVIITFGYPASLAAKTLARDMPIVCTGAGDPVATGLAQSLARPGGNLTGVTELATELSAKRLEILKEAVPNLKKAAMLFNAADLGMTLRSRAAEAAAKVLNVSVQSLGVREPADFGNAFAEMTRSRPDAILMVSDTLTGLNRKLVMEFAANNRLPAMYEFGFLVRDGGLMSYGPNLRETGESRRPCHSHPSRRTAGGFAPRTAHSLRVYC